MKSYPKSKPWRSKPYRKWISDQPCAKCYAFGPCDPHHERYIGGGGIGVKPSDTHCIPLCHICHTRRHDQGAETFWGGFGSGLKRKLLEVCSGYLHKWNNLQKLEDT